MSSSVQDNNLINFTIRNKLNMHFAMFNQFPVSFHFLIELFHMTEHLLSLLPKTMFVLVHNFPKGRNETNSKKLQLEISINFI